MTANWVTEIKINVISRGRFLAKLQYSTMLLSNFHSSSDVLCICKIVELGKKKMFSFEILNMLAE